MGHPIRLKSFDVLILIIESIKLINYKGAGFNLEGSINNMENTL